MLEREPNQFRDAQASRKAEMQHRAVSNSQPCRGIWCVKNSANFFHREMPHQGLSLAFDRDGMDLLRLRQEGRHAELDVADESFYRGESSVARGCAVPALFLDMCEEVEDQRGVELLKAEL